MPPAKKARTEEDQDLQGLGLLDIQIDYDCEYESHFQPYLLVYTPEVIRRFIIGEFIDDDFESVASSHEFDFEYIVEGFDTPVPSPVVDAVLPSTIVDPVLPFTVNRDEIISGHPEWTLEILHEFDDLDAFLDYLSENHPALWDLEVGIDEN